MKNSHIQNIEQAIKSLSQNDKVIHSIIKKYEICNIQPHRNYFNALTKSIIGQQLSIKSANAIIKRFYSFYNNSPQPEIVIKTSHQQLRDLGLSNAKARYVRDLSEKIIEKKLNLKGISKKSSDEIIMELTKVTGIGLWTSHMFLIFTLGRLNILPFSDLGIRKAIMLNYGFKNLPTNEEVINLAAKNKWTPYSSVAAWYLWRTLD